MVAALAVVAGVAKAATPAVCSRVLRETRSFMFLALV
jgi:hypothetical protein